MAHKFNVGQTVELERSSLRSAVLGPYEIRHLIPASDRDPDDPCYRIKSIAEKHERANWSDQRLNIHDHVYHRWISIFQRECEAIAPEGGITDVFRSRRTDAA